MNLHIIPCKSFNGLFKVVVRFQRTLFLLSGGVTVMYLIGMSRSYGGTLKIIGEFLNSNDGRNYTFIYL